MGPAAGRSVSRLDKRAVADADDPLIFEPRESIGVTAEWLTRLREAVGPTPVLGIDYHHRLNVAEAASFCQRMPAGTLDVAEAYIQRQSFKFWEAPHLRRRDGSVTNW